MKLISVVLAVLMSVPVMADKIEDARKAAAAAVEQEKENARLVKEKLFVNERLRKRVTIISKRPVKLHKAIKSIGLQTGVLFDAKASAANVGAICNLPVTPRIKNMVARDALWKLLKPLGITYETKGMKLTLCILPARCS